MTFKLDIRIILLVLVLFGEVRVVGETQYTASLPSGKVKVDVMDLVAPPRAAELAAKIQTAVQKNQQWWLSFVKNAKPGQPLPYDPRLGVTAREYAEYLDLAGQTRLGKVSEAELEFRRAPDGRISVIPSVAIQDLAGIVIDTRRDTVETPFGRAQNHSDIVASENQRTTGPWNGIQWKYESLGPTQTTGTVMQLALGRRVSDGRAILYYTGKRVEQGAKPQQVSRILFFTFPK